MVVELLLSCRWMSEKLEKLLSCCGRLIEKLKKSEKEVRKVVESLSR